MRDFASQVCEVGIGYTINDYTNNESGDHWTRKRNYVKQQELFILEDFEGID